MSPDILLFISDQHAPQYQAGGRCRWIHPTWQRCGNRAPRLTLHIPPARSAFRRACHAQRLAPHHTGIFTNNDTLSQTTPTFLHAMAAAGYETVLVGRMHFIGPDQRHGFTRRVAPDFTNSGWVRPQKTLEQDFGVHTQTMGYKWCIDVVGGALARCVL